MKDKVFKLALRIRILSVKLDIISDLVAWDNYKLKILWSVIPVQVGPGIGVFHLNDLYRLVMFWLAADAQ